MQGLQSHPFSDAALMVVAPAALAVLEIFHPHVHDVMALDVRLWLTVHYAQMPLFVLAALGMAWTVRAHTGVAALLCRAAMFVFAVSYLAFDTAAGIVTGVLVQAAHASGMPELWRAPIQAVWAHPVLGGAPGLQAPPVLAVLGAIAWPVGAVCAAISLKRRGAAWAPCVLLALSSFGLIVFRTHAWPGGPVTFGGLAVAAAWILWQPARPVAAAVTAPRTG
jgi:hypothetical protein